MLYVTTIKSK